MVLERSLFLESDLDGEDPGGYVVVNVNAPTYPCQMLDDEASGGYFQTLNEAREACRRFREESGNDEIYVYALIGVREAVELHASEFSLA